MALPPYASGLKALIVDAVTAETEGALTDLVTDATTQADRASLQAFLGNQPFADETELEAYTNALLEVGDSTITRDGGVYVLTDLDPLTWVREDDSDGKKAGDAAGRFDSIVPEMAAESGYLLPFVIGGEVVGAFEEDGTFAPNAFRAPNNSINYSALALAVQGLLFPEGLSGAVSAASPESDWAFVIGTDGGGAVGFKSDGSVVGSFDAGSFDLSTASYNTAATSKPLLSDSLLVGFGDSTMEGAGASSSSSAWRSLVASELGVTLVNMGIGSQLAEQIAARLGVVETTLSVSGGSIPSSGLVSVTVISPSLLFNGSSSSTRTIDGKIGTAPVRITRTTGNTYNIEQIGGTGSLAVADGSVFVPDNAMTYRDSTLILCAGTNDRSLGDPAATADTIISIVNFIRPYFKRVLVIGPRAAGSYGGSDTTREVAGDVEFDTIVAIKSILSAVLGDAFVDVPQFMIDHGLTIAGISPTAQDLLDIADSIIPESLRADSLHSNNNGHIVEAWLIQRILTARSFV